MLPSLVWYNFNCSAVKISNSISFLGFSFSLCVLEFGQEIASAYEKAVFEALMYLIYPDGDDDLAVELHSKVIL